MTMKKILFTMIAMLMTLALNAQISVWDGTYENWDTIHSGTADDPILIENAAQLARMSQLIYCSQEPKYYKLTTDIDLDNRLWNPIGYIASVNCPEFNGYFDGDNHTIYNPSNTLFYSTYNGYIKNLTTRGSVVYREAEYYNFGLITYWAPLVENCHNYCDIIINAHSYMTAGSIAGECNTIINCSNHGNITINVDNCYYINTIASINDYGSPKSESEMKTQDFVNLLNDGGNFYAMDDLYVNRGFPIFAIYYSVDETVFENKISVYPNPANSVVTISGDNLLKIEIFNIIGQTVFSTICNADENTINIANLNSGIYLIKVGTTNGKEFATRIVKE